MRNELDFVADWGILARFFECLERDTLLASHLLSSTRDESYVFSKVPRESVIAGMCDLPGEIGDPEEGTTDPANTVVEIRAERKCPLATYSWASIRKPIKTGP